MPGDREAAPASVPRAAPGDGSTSASAREIARTGSLTVAVTDPVAAAAELHRIAEAHDGFVSNESIQTTESSRSSTVTMSVPSAKLDTVMDAAAKVGTVTNRSTTAKDVTAQVVDTDARVKTLRDSIARIRALMDRAGTVTEIAAVESELTTRQAQLESMLAQQQALRTQVDRAPVTVTLVRANSPEANPFLAGLSGGWEAMKESAKGLLIVVGALIPWLVVGAAIGFPVAWWVRKRRASRPPKSPVPSGYVIQQPVPMPGPMPMPGQQGGSPQGGSPQGGGPQGPVDKPSDEG